MAKAMLIDFFKPARTGESTCTLSLHLAEEARTCSDDRKTACQTAMDTKGSSTSAVNQGTDGAMRSVRVLIMPVIALVLGLGIVFASAYIRMITVLSRIRAYTPG